MTVLFWLVLGLALLLAGGELLVRGASRLAALFGISPLVIGLTVVAFGTSSPELAVTVQASLYGESDIALANVVGSNIFNILFILGICALILPLVVAQQLVRQDVPIMIGISFLVFGMAANGRVSRAEGAFLVLLLLIYLVFLVRQSRQEKPAVRQEYETGFAGSRSGSSPAPQVFIVGIGLAALVIGARWLVWGAVEAAETLGVSQRVIGLTVIAAGTSLPEVATSIVASLKGERDIAIGNVVGSNIFNLLGILGAGALISGQGLPASPAALAFDVPVMIAVAVACLPVFFTGHLLARWEGGLFLGYFVLYSIYLVMMATAHEARDFIAAAIWLFVIPLTLITVLVTVFRSIRSGSQTS
jgi:cation:H+ antiporter